MRSSTAAASMTLWARAQLAMNPEARLETVGYRPDGSLVSHGTYLYERLRQSHFGFERIGPRSTLSLIATNSRTPGALTIVLYYDECLPNEPFKIGKRLGRCRGDISAVKLQDIVQTAFCTQRRVPINHINLFKAAKSAGLDVALCH